MCVYAPTALERSIYKPLVCLILQGAKQVVVGPDTHEFAAGRSAIVTAHIPAVSRVTRASRVEPYVALAIEFDMAVLHDLGSQTAGKDAADAAAVLVDDMDVAVAGCALRLLGLMERPDAIPVLRPSIMRELHYWLLQGRHGTTIRRLARPSGAAYQVARAVAVLRDQFDRPLRVDDLAAVAGMSPSTFHHHFRAVTSLSPMQFQKQLRLIEARRRMLGEEGPVSRIAFAVGYESVPQFTREYARMFGLPPARDRCEARAA